MAGWRETETLKAIDEATVWMVSESPGRNASERGLAPKHPGTGRKEQEGGAIHPSEDRNGRTARSAR
jgi:hypothetical protein